MKFSTLLLLVMLFAISVMAQDHPSVTAQSNTVYVGADGKFDAVPDTAELHMNVSGQDNKPKEAYELASKNVDQIRQVLRANGIDPKTATVGFFSVQPRYEWSPKQKLVGYRVTTDVTLKLKDFSKIGPITEQLAAANVSESQTLNYTLENMDDAKNKAVEDAYRRARNSADAIARVSGRTVGELSYASVDTFESPRVVVPMARPMMARAQVAAPAPTEEFAAQNVTATAHVNAVFTLK
jgi:uncharacterized protein YggE